MERSGSYKNVIYQCHTIPIKHMHIVVMQKPLKVDHKKITIYMKIIIKIFKVGFYLVYIHIYSK